MKVEIFTVLFSNKSIIDASITSMHYFYQKNNIRKLHCGVWMTKGTAAPRLTDEGAAIITNIITQDAYTETLIPYSNNDIIIAYSHSFGYKKMLN